MDKKKIFLISSIALILIIAIICVIVFGKDKNTSKDNNKTTSKVTEATSTETVTETNSETETESSSEVETTTEETTTVETTTEQTTTEETTTEETTTVEQPSTEAPTEKLTEKPTEKPTSSLEAAGKLTPSGSYTEYGFQLGKEYGEGLEGLWIVRKTYENGAIRDYLVVNDQEYELASPIGADPENYEASGNGLQILMGEPQTQPPKSDEEITKEREDWIRENYGDKFTCNGIEFVYNETYEKFCTTRKTSYLHLITSATTSTIGYNYQIEYYPFLADYLGYTGTDNRPFYYNNTETFDYPKTLETGSTESDVEGTNKAFLKQLGWEEPIPVGDEICGWDYISTEGVPITVERDGYLRIYIKYSADETYSEYSFTIEEYNEFVASHTWTVCSEHIYVSWYESEPDLVIRKYLQVE